MVREDIEPAVAHVDLGFDHERRGEADLGHEVEAPLEWGRLGLRVNAVAPGSVRVAGNAAAEDLELDRRAIPLGRRGQPEDVAGAVLFLLSDLSRWITGQVLAVDGGASVKPSYLDDDGLPVFVRDEALRRRLLGA